jgi:transposase
MSLPEAARLLGVSYTTAYDWLQRGWLTAGPKPASHKAERGRPYKHGVTRASVLALLEKEEATT